MDKYLVTLSEIDGDITLYLVDQDIFDWICMKRDFPKERFLTEHDDPTQYDKFNHTVGSSPDNDRAMECSCFVDDDEQFYSVKDLVKFVQTNKVNIVDEYIGVVY